MSVGVMRKLTAMQTMDVADFIIERDTAMLSWPHEILRDFIDFYTERGALGIVNEGGRIIGVGVARPCRVEGVKSSTCWDYNEFGDCMHIHTICADKAFAVPILWQMMVTRFGRRDWISGRRHGVLKIWPFKAYEKKVEILRKM